MPTHDEFRSALQLIIDATVATFHAQILFNEYGKNEKPKKRANPSFLFDVAEKIISKNQLLKTGNISNQIEQSLHATISVLNNLSTPETFKKSFTRSLEEAFDFNMDATAISTQPPVLVPVIKIPPQTPIVQPKTRPTMAILDLARIAPAQVSPPTSLSRPLAPLQPMPVNGCSILSLPGTNRRTTACPVSLSSLLKQNDNSVEKVLERYHLSLEQLLLNNRYTQEKIEQLSLEFALALSMDAQYDLNRFLSSQRIELKSLQIDVPFDLQDTEPKQRRIPDYFDEQELAFLSENEGQNTAVSTNMISVALRELLPKFKYDLNLLFKTFNLDINTVLKHNGINPQSASLSEEGRTLSIESQLTFFYDIEPDCLMIPVTQAAYESYISPRTYPEPTRTPTSVKQQFFSPPQATAESEWLSVTNVLSDKKIKLKALLDQMRYEIASFFHKNGFSREDSDALYLEYYCGLSLDPTYALETFLESRHISLDTLKISRAAFLTSLENETSDRSSSPESW